MSLASERVAGKQQAGPESWLSLPVGCRCCRHTKTDRQTWRLHKMSKCLLFNNFSLKLQLLCSWSLRLFVQLPPLPPPQLSRSGGDVINPIY